MNDVGVVVIGRNEGERLAPCLRSVTGEASCVYVDSGSRDDSVATAREAGVRVVELDPKLPFTAARARNEGRAILPPDIAFVQFVDGDCLVAPDWLSQARAALAADAGLGAVSGRLHERFPERSVYNWLCDVEWERPVGAARAFGGIAMLRAAAFDQAGGFASEIIAGEEPDLAIRMRSAGWRIAVLDHDMAVHDAAMFRFGQWWRRSLRSGYAYVVLALRHRRSTLHDYGRRSIAVLFWGAAVPLCAISAIGAAAVARTAWPLALAGAALLLVALQLGRIARHERRRRPSTDAWTLAAFLMLAKPAQAWGVIRGFAKVVRRAPMAIVEHK